MKTTHIFSLLLVLTFVLSACGAAPAPTPEVSAADVQNTAIAAAFTVVAQTQAAVPTNTPIPPTETPTQTPPPTDTPIPTETSTATVEAIIPTATTVVQAGGNADPCNKVLQANPLGKPTKIKLENNTGAPITASIYLNLTAIGECGYRGYNISKGGSVLITDMVQGCYNVSVFVNDTKKPTKSFGYGCINNPDQWTFAIGRESVELKGR